MRKLPEKRSPPKRRVPKLAPEPKRKKETRTVSERWDKCSAMNDKGIWNRVGWVCPLTEQEAIYVDKEKARAVNRPMGHYRQVYIMDYGFTIVNETDIAVGGITLAYHRNPPKRPKLPPKRGKPGRKAPPKRSASGKRPTPAKKAPPKRRAPPKRKR